MIKLINFLGLHDLAGEIRRVVARSDLNNLFACLSPQQQHYLKICLNQKEQLIAPKLGINFKKIDCKMLLHKMHQRGIARLGKALSSQHPDFIWHFTHTLDVGRGSLLSAFASSEPVQKVTQALVIQITTLANHLKKSRS